ncbi:MAG: FAD-dependent oxidoreductase [Eubacteriales bacterium]|nr:FAD-dependent oxidoreductase [Eubacteriales bacterium]
MQENVYCRLANVIDNMPADADGGRVFDDSYVKILRTLLTERQAEICALVPKRYVAGKEIAEAMKVPLEEISEDLNKSAMRGVLYVATVDGEDMFKLANWAPGIMEHCMLAPEYDFDIKVVAEAFHEQSDPSIMLPMMASFDKAKGSLRAIPIKRSIKAETKTVSHEELETYLNQSDIYSVADCACRKCESMLGNPCEHPYKDICIQIGAEAEYYIRTGRARRVSREEVEAILLKAEELGLVHEVFNNEGINHSTFICNCCGCSCGVLRREKWFRTPDFSRSNFVAEVNPENCVACGACTETCSMNAIRLGNEFCNVEDQVAKLTHHPADSNWTLDDMDADHRVHKMVGSKGTSPCKTKCPAHISVQGYIRKAAQGKYDEALKVIKRENPFPAVCGRVCPHGCEDECTRARVDEAVAIDDIKKFIADKELQAEHRFIPEIKAHYEEKVAVIGAGPAGMTAAYYLAAEGYPVTVFERNVAPGGMLKFGIPSFRLEKDIIDAEIDVLRQLGVEFKCGVDVGEDVTIAELREQGYKAFYVAIGAQNGRKLKVEGEELAGVKSGIDFLRSVNLGDLAEIEGDTVVVGGGNVALDVARAALRLGNRNVQMFCLESENEMNASADEKEESLEEGIVINNGWGPKRILGENGRVTGVEFMRCVSVFNEEGRFAPKYDEQDTMIVPCSNVYAAIGQSVDWGRLLADTKADTNGAPFVKVADITYQTGEEDIFAGGDCAIGPKFVIDAIATGKAGAVTIHRYLRGYGLTSRRERDYYAFNKDTSDYSGYDKMVRQRPRHADVKEAVGTMSDTRATFTEEQLKKEAQRCLGCGVAVVDPYMCIGCGLCATKCEFEGVKLKKVYDATPSETPESFVSDMMTYMGERAARIAAKEGGEGKATHSDVDISSYVSM